MLLNTIRQWLKQLVDWEKRVIMRYEDWVFESSFDPAHVHGAILHWIDRKEPNTWDAELARLYPAPKRPKNKYVLGLVHGEHITLWARPDYGTFLVFFFRFVGSFDGRIVGTPDGSMIAGTYGLSVFGRGFVFWRLINEFVLLCLINLAFLTSILMAVLGLGAIIDDLFVLDFSVNLRPFVALALVAFSPAPVLFVWFFFKVHNWIDSSARRTVHQFLDWISKYSQPLT
jgi:hypothetical protein